MSRFTDLLRGVLGAPFSDDAKAISNQAQTSSQSIRRGTPMHDIFSGIGHIDGLPVVTEYTAMSLSTIWACVNLISGAISALPIHIYDRAANGDLSRRENDNLWWTLNEEFCPRWVAHAAWQWMAMSRLLHGDAFAEIKRTGPNITGIVPLHPKRVDVLVWGDGSRLAYRVYADPNVIDGETRIIDQDDMLHVPSLGFDGCRSLSPLRHALQISGGVALSAQSFSGQFFANMARPDYALTTDKPLTEEIVEGLRSQIQEKHAHSKGMSHRPVVLDNGLKISPITMPNEDAELIATRQFQTEELARVYGVPPFMIGHTEKTTSWGTGIAEMGSGFVRYVLRPHLNAFSNEINRKFFRTNGTVAKFDTFELERADLKTLLETFRAAVGRAGEDQILTTEEVRRMLNYPVEPEFGTLKKGAENEPAETV